MAIEIVDLPSDKMVIFHSYVNVYQRVADWTFRISFSSCHWCMPVAVPMLQPFAGFGPNERLKYFRVEVIWLGMFDHDRTLSSRTLESWFILGKSSPAELFRLVKYYHLPRYMVPIVTIDGYIYGIYGVYGIYSIYGIYMVYIWYIDMATIIYPDLGLNRIHQIPRTKRRDALYFPKSLLAEGAT